MDTRKQSLINALQRFIAQRPGLEFGNYGDVSAYRSEMRSITKDRHHAETMLRAISWRDSITADAIIEASRHAFSGRLTITEPDPGRFVLDYCTGQYWPTEYRRAVCAVLSSALWGYWRSNIPAHEGAETYQPGIRDMSGAIRKTARAELSRSIAHRWFN
jgi:hypothetical protein